jgi:pimeloyl-ACP methyl ester carboxylesterase
MSSTTRRRQTVGVAQAVLGLILVVVMMLVLLWTFQRRLIYFPTSEPAPRARAVLEHARDVRLRTRDGLDLGAYYLPALSPELGFAVLVANGNAGDRALRAPLARELARRGLAVLLFDYRGYAGNPGDPSEAGLALDARAAYGFLTEKMGIRPDRLIYYGESLGAAVVSELATRHPPAGIVLRSPFTDLAAVGREHYPFLPVATLLRDRFPITEHIRRVAVPTAVIYGSHDSIVPPEQSRAVAEAAGASTVVEIDGADHNDAGLVPAETRGVVKRRPGRAAGS